LPINLQVYYTIILF